MFNYYVFLWGAITFVTAAIALVISVSGLLDGGAGAPLRLWPIEWWRLWTTWWSVPASVLVAFFITVWALIALAGFISAWKWCFSAVYRRECREAWAANAIVREREAEERRKAEEEARAHRVPLLDSIASAHGRYLRVMEEARKSKRDSTAHTSDEKQKNRA